MPESHMNEYVEWDVSWDDRKQYTRVIAGGFQNVFDPNHRKDEPLYSVIKSGEVVESLQSILTPCKWEGIDMIGWRSCILASLVWSEYPKYGVWLVLDLETQKPIQTEYQTRVYALASSGTYEYLREGLPSTVFNAHIWPIWSHSQYTLLANIAWWDDGAMIIQEIFQSSLSSDKRE